MNKKVLIAILVRNKGHLLNDWLNYLVNFDYDKKDIVLYINTNNNKDETEIILDLWVNKYKTEYNFIEYDKHDVKELYFDNKKPHSWTPIKLNTLALIREKSLKKTLEYNCDYYFVSDIDNFILPHTLKKLIECDKEFISPMLKCRPEIGDNRSNFYYDNGDGYAKTCDKYNYIVHREIKGIIEIPVIHCCYLIKASILDRLSFFDGYNDVWEFIKLIKSAKKHNIKRYLINDMDYGIMFQRLDNKLDIKEEREYYNKRRLKILP